MPLVIGDRRLRLRPHLKHQLAPGNGVFLLSEGESWLLRGSVYQDLIPLLNGGGCVNGMAVLLATGHHPADLYAAIDTLRGKGYVEEQTDGLPLNQASFWQAKGGDSALAESRLNENPVSVTALGGINAEPFNTLLGDSGVRVDSEARRWVVLTTDYLHGDLEALAEKAPTTGSQWLLCKPVGTEVWIGPVFGPNSCWHCMAHRLKGHRKVQTYLSKTTGAAAANAADVPHLAATLHLGYAAAASQAALWIAEPANFEIERSILTLDVRTLRQTRHVVPRRPQCPVCGDASLVANRQRQPVTLASQVDAINAGGGLRICSSEETEQRLQHQISPITGLVGAIYSNVPVTVTSSLVQSYAADGLCGRRDFRVGKAARQRSAGGKGVSAVQARVSALSEAIERYSGEFQGDEARLSASYRSLAGQAIHPNTCMLFSERQYAERDGPEKAPETIPEPLDENAEIEWSPVWPLDGGPARYLPTAFCFYDAYGEGARFAIADSNGCAAGNCKEEAILQGLLELVERDAVAMWWYNRVRRPGVSLESFYQPFFDDIQAYYHSIHRDLWVLDVTNDLGIPVFAAVSRRTDKEAEDILIGFGAHLDADTAIQRALTEVNQSLPAVLDTSADNSDYKGNNQAAIAWWQNATLQTEPYLSRGAGPQACAGRPGPANLSEEILACAATLTACGLQVFVQDQTRPDTGLDVVRVIVPGLRHFRPRFAPGRLYDVPVDLKWIPKARHEHELNCYSVYF